MESVQELNTGAFLALRRLFQRRQCGFEKGVSFAFLDFAQLSADVVVLHHVRLSSLYSSALIRDVWSRGLHRQSMRLDSLLGDTMLILTFH